MKKAQQVARAVVGIARRALLHNSEMKRRTFNSKPAWLVPAPIVADFDVISPKTMSAVLAQKMLFVLLLCGAILGMSGCASRRLDGARIEKKAEEYRRDGVARDMVEARRMAEDYYWPDSARIREQAARSERDAAMPKK